MGVALYAMWNLYRPGGPGEAAIVIPTQPGVPSYTITPKYWTLRQYTKWVKPGAVRFEAASDGAEVKVSAFRDDAAGKIVAVAINVADTPRWVLFEGAELEAAPQVVRTSATENGVELPLDSNERFGARSALLPARSVTTFAWTQE
jgi:O-glycosyl hydrolase